MRTRAQPLLFAIAVVICLLLLSGQSVYCRMEDRESVAEQAYAYTPVQWKQTDQADFALGTTVTTSVTASPGNVVLAPATNIVPSVYALAGGNTRLFYIYTVTSNTWVRGADAPAAVANGGKITSDGQRYVYAFQGGSTAFWRHDASLGTWSVLAVAPGTVSAGSDLHYSLGKIYALQGGSTAVWVYDILNNAWSTIPITGTQYTMGAGSSIAVAGSYLYVYRPTAPFLMRVPTTGGPWSSAASDVTQPSSAAGLGSDIVITGADSMTFLFGGGKVFKTYVPSSRTWASLSNTPANVRVGGGLTYQPSNAVLTGTSYFALAGGNSKAFWKYTSAGGWSAMSNIPNNVGAGGGLTYIYSTTSQCSPGGYFVSSVKDTGKDSQVMNSIIWDEVIPNNPYANIKLETRISNTLVGGVPNAPWVTATTQATHTGAGTYYASLLGTTGRYVQYRVTMTTGDVTMASPALNEVRVYYLGI